MRLNKTAHARTWAQEQKTHPQYSPAPTGKRIEDLPILKVWRALGGGPLRGGRGRAFWRDGDGFNVQLYPKTGTWKDFAGGDGGGILALVGVAMGCDKREALAWLADYCGLDLAERTPQERRDWRRRREVAEAAERLLAERTEAHLGDLRVGCGLLLRRYHRLMALAYERQEVELVARAEAVYAKLDELVARRDFLTTAPAKAVIEYFASFGKKVVA